MKKNLFICTALLAATLFFSCKEQKKVQPVNIPAANILESLDAYLARFRSCATMEEFNTINWQYEACIDSAEWCEWNGEQEKDLECKLEDIEMLILVKSDVIDRTRKIGIEKPSGEELQELTQECTENGKSEEFPIVIEKYWKNKRNLPDSFFKGQSDEEFRAVLEMYDVILNTIVADIPQEDAGHIKVIMQKLMEKRELDWNGRQLQAILEKANQMLYYLAVKTDILVRSDSLGIKNRTHEEMSELTRKCIAAKVTKKQLPAMVEAYWKEKRNENSGER